MAATSPEVGHALALAAAMQELMGHPAWDLYTREMERLETSLMERLVHATADLPNIQGQIVGLRLAYDTPRRIIQAAQGAREHTWPKTT